MQSRPSLLLRALRACARVGFGLVLLAALWVVMAGASPHAHAAAAATRTVTDCSGETGPGRISTVLGGASAGDTITFSCSGTIPISSTLTISTSNLTLDGSGQSVTLDGGNSTQVLSVSSGVSFTMNALTIAHGLAAFNNNDGLNDGGGLYNNGGTVTIKSSTFSGNSASFDFNCAGNGGSGGGIANVNGGTLSISKSTFANNSASIAGGGIANGDQFSGFSGGTLTISASTFTSNSANLGGGLANTSGTVNISTSAFSGNTSGDGGGGLDSESGTLTISGSTIANNSAAGTDNLNGGGVRNAFSSTVNISTSTFSGNTSADRGGGLHNGGGSTANISNSTFSGNTAPESKGGGISNDGTFHIGGSIVAANTGGDCDSPLTDRGYNLSSDHSCGFTGTGSLQNTDPKLGPLASNGGPTQTMALLTGSPAIDAIPLSSALCPTTDQRGHKRPDNPQESACDIGAYES